MSPRVGEYLSRTVFVQFVFIIVIAYVQGSEKQKNGIPVFVEGRDGKQRYVLFLCGTGIGLALFYIYVQK